MQHALVRKHARIHIRVGPSDAFQFDITPVGKSHVPIGHAIGVTPWPDLESELDRHDRSDLIDAVSPKQDMIEFALRSRRQRCCDHGLIEAKDQDECEQ